MNKLLFHRYCFLNSSLIRAFIFFLFSLYNSKTVNAWQANLVPVLFYLSRIKHRNQHKLMGLSLKKKKMVVVVTYHKYLWNEKWRVNSEYLWFFPIHCFRKDVNNILSCKEMINKKSMSNFLNDHNMQIKTEIPCKKSHYVWIFPSYPIG